MGAIASDSPSPKQFDQHHQLHWQHQLHDSILGLEAPMGRKNRQRNQRQKDREYLHNHWPSKSFGLVTWEQLFSTLQKECAFKFSWIIIKDFLASICSWVKNPKSWTCFWEICPWLFLSSPELPAPSFDLFWPPGFFVVHQMRHVTFCPRVLPHALLPAWNYPPPSHLLPFHLDNFFWFYGSH